MLKQFDVKQQYCDSGDDVELHGRVVLGMPSLGLSVQGLEKRHYACQREGGVRVTHVAQHGSCQGLLRENDVFPEVGGLAIAEDHSVQLRGLERVDYSFPLHDFRWETSAHWCMHELVRSIALLSRSRRPDIWCPGTTARALQFAAGFVFTTLTAEYMAAFPESGKSKMWQVRRISHGARPARW